MNYVQGIRGATTVEVDEKEEIIAATEELLEEICRQNDFSPEDVASAFFTLTSDLCATFPAEAARKRGWTTVPMLCATEIPVPGAMPKCIRVLIHVNTTKRQGEMCHVYLRRAVKLRPDWSEGKT
ncbi:MAG TPA: chorismate mutase [Symbiobacteriaceae bacterium]|nr:chorismate mutase [Symbiobacteriaceae bacterium]